MERRDLSVENAKIIFRNFSGKPTKFNPQGGRRGFTLILNPEVAEDLEREGWYVKRRVNRRDPDAEPTPTLDVKINYGSIRPNIYLVTKRKKTLLDEDTVGSLDYADIANIDLIVTPSFYDINGKQGIAAYVKNMYVTVIEDEFASKYDFDDEEEVPF